MDGLVELILELLGSIWGDAVNDAHVPKVVRTVLICLFIVPLIVVSVILSVGWLRKGNAGGGFFGLCVVLFFLIGLIVLLRRTWR
jgi:Na+/H+-dicarboxylate symporter